MGMIQGSINNLLTTAAVATRLSPELEEKRELKTTEKSYEKTEKLLEESDNQAYSEGIARIQRDRAQRIAELNPTKKNIQKYIAEMEGYESIQPETISEEKAVTEARAAEVEQKKAFQKELMQGYEEIEKPSRAAVQKRLAEKKAAEALQMEQDRISKGGTV